LNFSSINFEQTKDLAKCLFKRMTLGTHYDFRQDETYEQSYEKFGRIYYKVIGLPLHNLIHKEYGYYDWAI